MELKTPLTLTFNRGFGELRLAESDGNVIFADSCPSNENDEKLAELVRRANAYESLVAALGKSIGFVESCRILAIQHGARATEKACDEALPELHAALAATKGGV